MNSDETFRHKQARGAGHYAGLGLQRRGMEVGETLLGVTLLLQFSKKWHYSNSGYPPMVRAQRGPKSVTLRS